MSWQQDILKTHPHRILQHAKRVLRILGVEDQIEGVIFCDYANPKFACKPEPEYFHNVRTAQAQYISLDVPLSASQALWKANVQDPSKCCFVDDSRTNVLAAKQLGWGRCVHFCERGLVAVEGGKPKEIGSDIVPGPDDEGITTITDLEELRTVWSDLFKAS